MKIQALIISSNSLLGFYFSQTLLFEKSARLTICNGETMLLAKIAVSNEFMRWLEAIVLFAH